MSEEDIKEALKIIKQPIIVNCKDYKYFDQENYDNLIRVYDNCLWYVNTSQPLLEQLQQENKELKAIINEAIESINGELENDGSTFMYCGFADDLLEILKGYKCEEKEENK